MEVRYEIKYHYLVIKEDIVKLDAANKRRIKSAIKQKLVFKPEIFGKPLRKSLKNYRKLRVGNFRVVFKIENRIIKILAIKHRALVYQEALKRLS